VQAITATMRLVGALLVASMMLMVFEATPALGATRRSLQATATETLEGMWHIVNSLCQPTLRRLQLSSGCDSSMHDFATPS
jgi:hypothetical protein